MKHLQKILYRLFSTSIAGLYIILFAVAIAVATFIENDFGTSSAQKVIFKAWWFEMILLLFGISLVVNIFRFNMINQKKWATLTFHAAMIIILIGAGVTRYFGSEGMMHIRKGSTSSTFLSSETYLKFEVWHQDRKFQFDEPVLFATLGDNNWQRSYMLGNEKVLVEVIDFMPNPQQQLKEVQIGVPIIKIVVGGENGREEYFLKLGEKKPIHGTLFNFGNQEDPNAFNIQYQQGELVFKSNTIYTQTQMAIQKKETLLPGDYRPLLTRSLYSNEQQSFAIGDFIPQGALEISSSSEKMTSTSTAGLNMRITIGEEQQQLIVYGSKGVEGRPRTTSFRNSRLAVSYGAKKVALPFSIKLNEFIMERYPGTNSASSYASEVTLIVPEKNITRPQRIYMNHILNYGGYRFFQSSYDRDELGTYLSVNHDRWGTWISYLGYALLTIGMVLTLFKRGTRFSKLGQNIKKMRQSHRMAAVLIGLLVLVSFPTNASPDRALHLNEISPDHARQFGQLIMQDHNGRLKPMNTFTSEILRKLSREESLYELTAEQIVLGMAANPKDWYGVPLIKLGKNPDIHKILGKTEGLVAYRDFFETNGTYKLRTQVRSAYNTPQRDRGALEKELLKLDERINICSMVFSGRFLKTFPIPDHSNNQWQAPGHFGHQHETDDETSPHLEDYPEEFYQQYISALHQGLHVNDWSSANILVAQLDEYQQLNGGEVIPSKSKLKAELLLNNMNIFNRLGRWYGLLTLAFLALLFTSVFRPRISLKWPFRISLGFLALCFILHTLGLGLRWYIAGRAPWSNGYESMIYIGFTTVLAGLLFTRKSYGGLAATSALAATILMVAGLSWLDPEITPLVPVLKSYWLTIHVSLEAGSYGFLMLGAIIGVINLILMIFANRRTLANTNRIIKEMTYISEMTLIGGLFMISVGTYLGGVWANESWGRYWGWDAKETWALVTILVYAFILHMRFIPGFRGAYAFNVASLFGWASVLMTYFGVNYYLSGLHSYAAGDPVPIPPFVYYTVIILTVISLTAYWRQRQNSKRTLSLA